MPEYPLAHAEPELRRLTRQGRLYEAETRRMISEAGVRSGHHVLDVGCGGGDVSLLLADAVGPKGRVTAVDRSPEALARTQARAQAAGVSCLDTVECDLETYAPSGPYDVIVGRLVLMFVGDPISLLWRLAGALSEDGVIAFAEQDTSTFASDPPSPLLERIRGWILNTMRRSGAEPDMGGKLHAAFAAAGLEAALTTFNLVDAGRGSAVMELASEVVASLAPAMEAMGLATAAEIDAGTLAARWRDEPDVDRRTFYGPRFTTAVARRRS